MPSAAVPLARAIEDSAPLARLADRLRDSRERFTVLEPALPDGLRPHVRPGPVDDQTWTLLAANASVAAKLRQLLPRFTQLLQDAGRPALDLRVRVTRP
jgi:hypothetical protein